MPIKNTTDFFLTDNLEELLLAGSNKAGRSELVGMLHECGVRFCRSCGTLKPIGEFNRDGSKPQGLSSACRECAAAAASAHRETHGSRINRENRKRHRDDPRHTMLKLAKRRAKLDGLPFDLTVDDIEIPERCPVLQIPIIVGKGKATDNSPSLDKIIPDRGYVRGNVIVLSRKANLMKSNATAWELWNFSRYIMILYEETSQ